MGNKVDSPASCRRFEADLPNDIWQSDSTHDGPMLMVGDKRREAYLFAFIDDMSRLIAHAEFYLSESPATYFSQKLDPKVSSS
ncbi:hypothetical protein DFAR_3250012 [Desulfarculales bacterium]